MDTLSIINDPKNIYFDKFLLQAKPGTPDAKLLDIFSYGTWQDYKQIENSLPNNLKLKSGSVGERTLKMLTLVSHFMTKDSESFETLAQLIDAKDRNDLESIVCDTIANGLIEGQINELTETVDCLRATSRCIRNNPDNIIEVINSISDMRSRIYTTLQEYVGE